MSTILAHIVNGKVALARIVANGLQKGDTVYIDTQTAPTADRKCIIKATVSKVNPDGTFDTHEAEPYFGYNKNWNKSQIVE